MNLSHSDVDLTGKKAMMCRAGALFVLLTLCFSLMGCPVRDDLFFDDPTPNVVLSGELKKTSRDGGTFYWGTAKNAGTLPADEVTVTITPIGSGEVELGTFTTAVGTGYSDEEGAINLLEADQYGYFTLFVPIPIGMIATERVSFSYILPEELEL